MTMKRSAVLFDLDGVTVDTEPLYTLAEIRLFGEFGVEIPEDDWSLFRGCSEQDFFDLSMKRYNINVEKNIFMEKGRKYVREEFRKNIAFMPGFHNLIDRVKKEYKIGLVTASPKRHTDWLNKLIGLDNIFKYIISGDETPRNKPHPDPYLAMMNQLNVLPQNSVIIEDSIHGIRSGLASGAHVIAKTGSIPERELSIADRIITHLDEVTNDMIEQLLQGNI